MILLGNLLKKNKKVSVEQSINQNEIISDDDEPLSENSTIFVFSFLTTDGI